MRTSTHSTNSSTPSIWECREQMNIFTISIGYICTGKKTEGDQQCIVLLNLYYNIKEGSRWCISLFDQNWKNVYYNYLVIRLEMFRK